MQVVSFSGGKDSTAMLFKLIEKGEHIDAIVYCDTGMEFPEMYEHIYKVEKRVSSLGVPFLRASFDFLHYMFDKEKRKGSRQGERGYLWPSMRIRWCSREKIRAINGVLREAGLSDAVRLMGIAADEKKRLRPDKKKRYPLAEWGMTERDCLAYCKKLGFDWGGAYIKRSRLSCWCCPLQRVPELEYIRQEHPDLWKRLLEMDVKVRSMKADCYFKSDKTVEYYEKRFAAEDRHLKLYKGGDAK